jgi:hypothetical protein
MLNDINTFVQWTVDMGKLQRLIFLKVTDNKAASHVNL